ncbi:MAG: bifunctional demethylmenaquinone methyltransferase/2-methoxy-6-polyprenyl-1,4-benzoquinol methylase UbiE [Muribaculaceae bacterium]|nr:bifunctional demethylmenaquinone methyltransferase/2-methoxy-6-polyprenyl-1,4-benzoquinol methylase UbiE [Muribaculaceae bacterium]
MTEEKGNRVEQVTPYGEGAKTEQVRQMFDSIAPAYDFMNRAMTLGIDIWWRRLAVKRLKQIKPQHILDVATGTGDFAIQLNESLQPQHITGIDLSQGMLDEARRKVKGKGLENTITFEQGDCMALPMGNETFDAVTVAFGVRNFEHLQQGYQEMARVLKPSGMLCVLELSTPTNSFIRWFYDVYTLHVIPWVGSLKSGDKSAYRYLPQSIAAVPQGDEMLQLMRNAGLHDTAFKRLTLGTCTIYTAIKRAVRS